ncbi:MAG: hypothetical protein AAF701_07745 [Pseudomonadota bacterium]
MSPLTYTITRLPNGTLQLTPITPAARTPRLQAIITDILTQMANA